MNRRDLFRRGLSVAVMAATLKARALLPDKPRPLSFSFSVKDMDSGPSFEVDKWADEIGRQMSDLLLYGETVTRDGVHIPLADIKPVPGKFFESVK